MKRSNYLIWLGIATVAGTAAGMLSNRKNPQKSGLIGAAAGIIAGTVSAKIYKCITEDDSISYYTKSSPLYEEYNDIEYV